MQTLVAWMVSSRAGLTMLAWDGFWTCKEPGPWHFSQPTFHSVTVLVWDVVVDGMAAITQRPGRALQIVCRVKGHPPIGLGGYHVSPPLLMRNVPLRPERIIIIALFSEITLLPLAAIDESNVVLCEISAAGRALKGLEESHPGESLGRE